MGRVLFLLFFGFYSFNTLAQKDLLISQNLFILEDTKGNLSLKDILKEENQQKFIEENKRVLHFQFSENWHWVKFELEKKVLNTDLLLEIGEAKIEFANFYFQNQKGEWQAVQNGYAIPLREKNRKSYFQIFSLPFYQSKAVFYLQIKGNAQAIPLSIKDIVQFEEEQLYKNLIYGLFYGLMLFIMLNNLIFGLLTQKSIYFVYVGLVFSYLLDSFFVSGYIQLFIRFSLKYFVVNSPLIFIWASLYAKLFLSIKNTQPIGKFLNGLIFIDLLVMGSVFFVSPMQAFVIAQISAPINLFSLIVITLISLKQKQLFAIYYLWALLLFTFFIILEIIYLNTGYLGYFYITYVEWASLSEMLILAYALHLKLAHDRKELQLAHEKVQTDNLNLIKTQNQLLEQKVAERTVLLENALQSVRSSEEQLQQSMEELQASEEELRQHVEALALSQEKIEKIAIEQEKFVSLVKHTNAFIYIANLDGSLIFLNEAAKKISGFGENYLDKYVSDYHTAYQAEVNTNKIIPIVLKDGLWRGESEIFNIDTRQIHIIDETVFLINDPHSGKPLYIASVQKDITKQKEAENAIKQQNEELLAAGEEMTQHLEELHAMQEQLEIKHQALTVTLAQNKAITNALDNSAIVSITDLRGTIIKVNKDFCEVSAYTEEELIGKNHRLLDAHFHSKDFWINAWNTITQGNTWRAEVCNKNKNGQLYWVDTAINPIYNENGEMYQYLSISYLITERKKAEQEVKLLQTLINQSSEAIQILNESGAFFYLNHTATKRIGIKQEEAHKYNVQAVEGNFAQEGSWEKHVQQLKTNGSIIVEGFHTNQVTKKSFPVEVSVKYTNIDGQGYVIASSRDVTERKRAEQLLIRTRDTLQRTSKIAKVGGWEYNILKNKMSWSELVYDIYGLSYASEPTLEGMIQYYKTGESRDEISNAIQKALQEGKAYDLELQIINANGSEMWVRLMAQVDFEDGISRKMVGILQDIDNRKKAEQTIQQQNQELQESLSKVILLTQQSESARQEAERLLQDITDSINYAKRIQTAMLPREEDILKVLDEAFILFKPRDIVSGDFYFIAKSNNKIILACADCTGHGVPGAFMSMIGNEILTNLVEVLGITSPDLILNELHKNIRTALKQGETENWDGMDITIVTLDLLDAPILEFAGAMNPIYYIRNNEFYEIKGDKMPIGGIQKEQQRIFTKHTIQLSSDGFPTMFYLFSDGFQDQFGGPMGKKFMVRRFKELLASIHHLPIDEQKKYLDETIMDWMHGNKKGQVDDILVVGVRI